MTNNAIDLMMSAVKERVFRFAYRDAVVYQGIHFGSHHEEKPFLFYSPTTDSYTYHNSSTMQNFHEIKFRNLSPEEAENLAYHDQETQQGRIPELVLISLKETRARDEYRKQHPDPKRNILMR